MISARCARCRTSVLLLLLSLCVACGRDTSSRSLVKVGKRWVAAWNERDPGTLLSLFDEDVVLWLPGMREQVHGKAAARTELESLWSARSDMQLHDNAIFVDDAAGKVAIDWSVEFKAMGTKLVQMYGVEILHVQKGMITTDRSVYNACDILAQLNAPVQPAAGETPPTPPAAAAGPP
jgi:ketosteroid isomerase-like protein